MKNFSFLATKGSILSINHQKPHYLVSFLTNNYGNSNIKRTGIQYQW